MSLNPYTILVCIALLLTVLSFLKPAWPLLAVAVLLLCVAALIKG